MTVLAVGELLMNGATVEWPPTDMNGNRIEIGCRVYAVSDTWNTRTPHVFTVGSLRLQNRDGELGWVACAYDGDCYAEAWARDCAVTRSAPMIQ